MSAALAAAVLIAGAVGALARYGVSIAFARRGVRSGRGSGLVAALPWPVLLVNVVGSAMGGVVLGLAQAGLMSPEWRLILLSGFCGGLTTFSTLSVESIQLVLEGRSRVAAVSVTANLVLGVAAAATAFALVLL